MVQLKRLVIAGPPHSGKTTVIKHLVSMAASHGVDLRSMSTGRFFRVDLEKYLEANPSAAGMTIGEFYKNHIPDSRIIEVNDLARAGLQNGDYEILDSRFAIVNALGLSNVSKVLITAPMNVRVERIFNDGTYPGFTRAEVEDKIYTREQSEAENGERIYSEILGRKFDLRDPSWYDLVIDTSNYSAPEAARFIFYNLLKAEKQSSEWSQSRFLDNPALGALP